MKYRKKPVTVDAVQWTGDNSLDTEAFLGEDHAGYRDTDRGRCVLIRTLENPDNPFEAPPGWWLIRGVAGEHYACDPDIFSATYEPAEQVPA